MELSGNNFLAYLGGRPPRCSMSEETRNWIQEYICNPLLSFAEHRLLSFVCVLLVPEYILAWVIGQYLKARKIVSVHKGELGTLNKTLDILNTQLHHGCSKTLAFFTITGDFHLFHRASKEVSHNAERIFNFQENDVPLHLFSFRDFYYNTTIDIDFSFTTPAE